MGDQEIKRVPYTEDGLAPDPDQIIQSDWNKPGIDSHPTEDEEAQASWVSAEGNPIEPEVFRAYFPAEYEAVLVRGVHIRDSRGHTVTLGELHGEITEDTLQRYVVELVGFNTQTGEVVTSPLEIQDTEMAKRLVEKENLLIEDKEELHVDWPLAGRRRTHKKVTRSRGIVDLITGDDDL